MVRSLCVKIAAAKRTITLGLHADDGTWNNMHVQAAERPSVPLSVCPLIQLYDRMLADLPEEHIYVSSLLLSTSRFIYLSPT